ncbi:MAG: hypothetical protein WCI92_01120 [Bacteroidota bacterium]
MKKAIQILVLVIIYFICGARSCNDGHSREDENNKKLLSYTKDSIKQAFEIDKPNDELLKSYETKACQKLVDFADYLKIAADTSINVLFRHQAAEMAGKLFLSKEINFRKWGDESSKTDEFSLDRLLEKSLSEGSAYWIQPMQIEVAEPLIWTNDSTYSGKLSFRPQYVFYNSQRVEESHVKLSTLEFCVIKNRKSFGKEQLLVWEVYLGKTY